MVTVIFMNNLIAVLFIMIMPILWAPASFAADASADSSELARKRIERQKQFLYRSVEDLNRSQEYVQAAVRELEKQIDALGVLEPSRREKDIASFLEWYRSYTEWLSGNLAEVEADLSRAYSDEQRVIVQPERYYSLLDGYARLGSQLEEQVSRLDKLNNLTVQRMAGLRTALEYVTSVAFIEERNREKKQHQQGNDQRRDELYERYKDITDIEIAMMQLELKNLDGLQKNFLVLLEMGAWNSPGSPARPAITMRSAGLPVLSAPTPRLPLRKPANGLSNFMIRTSSISRERSRKFHALVAALSRPVR
jgi:hypothetical protein